MLDIAIKMMYQGAKHHWPSITPEIFGEIGRKIVSRIGPDGLMSIEVMEKLIRTELETQLGPPTIPFS